VSTPLDRPTPPASRPGAGAYGAEQEGSRRITPPVGPERKRRTPLAWLPWAALGAIAALVLLSLLAINAVDDDGPDGPAGDSLGQSQASDGSGVNGEDGDGRLTADAEDAAGGGGAATSLTAGEQDLLGLTAGGSLTAAVGQPVTGAATVESVVSDEGFWVGRSVAERVFVFLTPQARRSSGESGFQVEAGQTVQLQGTAVAIGDLPDALDGVSADEGLEQLRTQGALVRADRVALAG
jgi:hypothetical protein